MSKIGKIIPIPCQSPDDKGYRSEYLVSCRYCRHWQDH